MSGYYDWITENILDEECSAVHYKRIPYKRGVRNNTEWLMRLGKRYLRRNKGKVEYIFEDIIYDTLYESYCNQWITIG